MKSCIYFDIFLCRYTYQKEVIGNVNGSICIKGTYETQNQRPCYNFNEKVRNKVAKNLD